MFCPGKNIMYVWLYVTFAALVHVGVDVMVMSSA